MNNWVLTGQQKIEKRPQSEQTIKPNEVKVKITHVLLTNYDALCYTVAKKIPYPKTIGRVAVGVVIEKGEGCYGVEKGSRVYMNAVRACGKCFSCKSGNRSECERLQIAGEHFDGFLRDFVVCEYSNVSVIPDQVDDFMALCIEHVALAENIFDNLNLSAGSRVAVVGAGFLGSILTQIALYHKLVPIAIDNYPANIDRLKRSGVFFTFPADDNLASNINDATSGEGCDAAIYTSTCKLTPYIPASVLARRKDMVIGGFCATNFSLATEILFEKSLRVYAVTDGYGYIETAINMLVHGAIDLSNFDKRLFSNEFDIDALLTEQAEKAPYFATMTVLKLVL